MAEARIVALHGRRSSVVLEITPEGWPAWRHWGARTETHALAPLAEERVHAGFTMDREVPLTLLPTAGAGWFGPSGLRCRRAGAAGPAALTVRDLEHGDGHCRVVLGDRKDSLAATVRLSLAPDSDVLRVAVTLRNLGATPLAVDRLASAVLPLPASARRLVSFTGWHASELIEHDEPMPSRAWLRETREGLTGHGGPPGLFVLGHGATWHAGEVWAAQLAWSGDHRIAVEADEAGGWTLVAGERLAPDEIVLAPGETLDAPELIACYSDEGRNGAVQGFHGAIRAGVAWPGGSMRPRPVHFNSWESVYFAHDESRMIALAEDAAALGCERFVLDDGWFAGRSGDHAGLGDWTPDLTRYPRGLAPLAERVNALGMEFGLWIEPEMVNPDSALCRANPERVLGDPAEAPPLTSRRQLVLDLARPEVRDHLFDAIATLLGALPIAYLKWDHNRPLAPNPRGRAQVRGAWALWERLREAFPQVENEACAAGGGRIDAGFAARAHRFWTSDNIDAVSRVAIQRGFLQFMPPEMMGAHVGASPAHATGRAQTLDMRAGIALPGHFGVELGPNRLNEAERARLAAWVTRYKAVRDRVHGARTWLGEGADGLQWQGHGQADDFLLIIARTRPRTLRRQAPLRLPILRGSGKVRVQRLSPEPAPPAERTYPAAWLAAHGLPLDPLGAEGSLLYEIRRAP